MSKIGISLTDHAIKRQCKLFKESPPISNEQTTKRSKKFKNEHLAFDIFESENTQISDENMQIFGKNTPIFEKNTPIFQSNKKPGISSHHETKTNSTIDLKLATKTPKIQNSKILNNS